MSFAYGVDLRKKVLNYLKKEEEAGNKYGSVSRASRIFSVARGSIYDWCKKSKEGDLNFKRPVKQSRKVDYEEVVEYTKLNPDLYLREIAAHFRVGETTIARILARYQITIKKKYSVQGKRRSQKKTVLTGNS